jgi:integrase
MKDQAKEWLQYQKGRVSEASFCKYHADVTKHIIPYLGECKVSDEENNYRILMDNLIGYKAKTIEGINGIFRRISKFNPDNEYEKSKKCKEEEELDFIPKGQFQFLMNELKIAITPTKIGVLCVVYTGIRLGELCSLRWKDVDLNKCVIRINKTIKRINPRSSENKTILKETEIPLRYVPIPIKLLRIFLANQGRPNSYILSGTEKLVEPRVVQNRLNAICRETGICTKVTFSSIRDYFAINAISNGINVSLIADILGVELDSIEKYIVAAKSMIDMEKEIEKLNMI